MICGRWLGRGLVLTGTAGLFISAQSIALRAQGADDLAALNKQVVELYQARRFAEATEVAKQSLVLSEKQLGPDHPNVGEALNNLAALYRVQGRSSEVEPLMKRALAIREKALVPDHRDVGTSLNNLAMLLQDQGRNDEAEPLYGRALAIYEKALGPNHIWLAATLTNIAKLYRDKGRYAEAEPLTKRVLAIRETALGPSHPEVAGALSDLALLYTYQGRYPEAELLNKRSLAILEKALGPDHPQVGLSLNNLARLYQNQGRNDEAEPLFRRSLAVREKALGPDHPDVGQSVNNLGVLYRVEGRFSEAEPLLKRALAIREKAFGSDHAEVGTSLNNLAELYREQSRYGEAEPLYKRSLAIYEKALGPDSRDVGQSLNSLGLLYWAQRRYDEAEPLYTRGLTISEKALGQDHPDVGITLNNLAFLAFARSDWTRAADFWRRSTGITIRRTERGAANVGQALTGKSKSETEQLSYQFRGLVKAGYRLASEGRKSQASLLHEMFQTAQWAQGSEAAASLAQMAARGAQGDPSLAAMVRERQDLVEDWQKRDGARNVAAALTPDKRDRVAEAANVARLTSIDARIAEIDKRLAADFPDYASLARPVPLSVEDVQAQLGANEALVLFLDTTVSRPTPEETFIWVLTKTEERWVGSELGTPALTREVGALRCGLDGAAWEEDGAAKCASLLKTAPDQASNGNASLPFDLARAHSLFKSLFGQVEDLIRDKHLLIVPSGPLSQLPFQVLVSELVGPSGTDTRYRNAAWLARGHAITVLPSVSSLKALRRIARPNSATKPMIGIGNPLLNGPNENFADLAKSAREKQHCPKASLQRVAGLIARRSGARPITQRSGLAEVADIRIQTPLPETADELCAVAHDLLATDADILLGARANERQIKSLSKTGALAAYRMVHFATHGVLAGQLTPGAEPGLILTPPEEASAEDDGYLSASEVAALKLDADWVVLSACNTAAGGAEGAEALSGLARAFFYAGARALLVSHWAVDSAATVKLITSAIGTMTHDNTVGRAEALRRAMLTMIDKGELGEAHPAYWAPFIVVGEGAAAAK